MGPLFSLGLIGFLASGAFVILFGASWIFLPGRRAAALAATAILAGGFGALAGGLTASLFLPRELLHTTGQVLLLLGSIAGGAVMSAILAGWYLVLRRPARADP